MAKILEFPKQQKETVIDTELCSACKRPLDGAHEYEYMQDNYSHIRVIAFCSPCEKEMQIMGFL